MLVLALFFGLKLRDPTCFPLVSMNHSTWKAAMALAETLWRWDCETLEVNLSHGELQGNSLVSGPGTLGQI